MRRGAYADREFLAEAIILRDARNMIDQPKQDSMFGVAGIGHAFLVGSVIGFLLTFLVTGGITLYATGQWGPSVGVGAFAAFWGGPGFGGMLGAVSAAGGH